MMTTSTEHHDQQRQVIENFAIHGWLSALLAVGFSGAIFAYFRVGLALCMMLIGFGASLWTLKTAYQQRHNPINDESTANGVVMAGLLLSAIVLFDKGMVLALLCLLFFLHLALNLHFKEHRQVYFGLIISFLGLMVGAGQTFSTGYLVFILLFCLCACFYLSVVFIDKQNYQHQSNIQYIGQARYQDKLILAVIISVFAGIIYLLTPHFSAGNLGKSVLQGFGQYDNPSLEQQILPENTDLSKHFQQPQPKDTQNQPKSEQSPNLPTPEQQLDNSIYYYVKSNQPRYLQHDVMSHFDGQSWQRLHYGWRQVRHDNHQFLLYPDTANASVSINVAKVPDNIKLNMLSTSNTVAVRFPSLWLARDYYDMLKTGDSLAKDTRYELLLDDHYQHERLADKQQAKPNPHDLQLPDNLDPRILQLGRTIVKNQSNDYQKAVALEQHLRTSYQYTLDTVPNQNNIPLSDFLFGSKRGHCEYYATAMTIMLRQQNIPARYVIGFVARDYNPVTGFYEVKGTNAHAWVEAYIDGHWQIFEATGAYGEQTSANQQNTQQALQNYLNNLQQQDQRLAETQKLSWQQQIQLWWYQFWSMILAGFQWFKLMLPYLVALFAVLAFGYFIYQKQRVALHDWWDYRQLQKVPTQQNTQELLHDYVKIYQQLLSRHGIHRQQGQSIEDFCQQLINKSLINSEQAELWINLTNQSFYQSHNHVTLSNEQLRLLFIDFYQQAKAIFTKQ